MSEAAYEDGSNRPHERLYSEVVAEEPGYFYIYLSNEDTEGGEAFFDDFTVLNLESYIVQQTDYYPYGLVARNFVRAGEKETFELFQGKTYDELTGWHDFHARQYDAALGRWFGVDAYAHGMPGISPYGAMANNPVMFVDPDGNEPITLLIMGAAALIGGGVNLWSNADNIRDWKSGVAYFASGAVGGIVSLGNPVLGGSITSAANVGIDLATGNMPDFDRPRDVLWYSAVKGLEGLSAGAAGNLAKGSARLLGKAGWFQFGSGGNAPVTLINPKLGLAGGVKVPEFTLTAVNIPGSSFAKVGAGKVGSLATKTVGSGTQYSVAFETKLASNLYPGKGYYSHFKAANTSLSNAMASDAAFSSSMSKLGISIPRSPTGNILGKSPANWVWHHDINTGVMQLVPKTQHTFGSPFWNTMHPGGIGGMSIWGR